MPAPYLCCLRLLLSNLVIYRGDGPRLARILHSPFSILHSPGRHLSCIQAVDGVAELLLNGVVSFGREDLAAA